MKVEGEFGEIVDLERDQAGIGAIKWLTYRLSVKPALPACQQGTKQLKYFP
jgi:hypothetical protein